MVYIVLQEGYSFKCMDSRVFNNDLESDQPIMHDYLIKQDPQSMKIVLLDLQDAVKDFLRHPSDWDNNKKEIKIYHRAKNVPHTDMKLLEYLPKQNGAKPGEDKGTTNALDISRPSHFAKNVPPGYKWFECTELSAARRRAVLDKAREQKKNRQHIGDSPCPT